MIHSRMVIGRTMRTFGGMLLACLLTLSVLMPSFDAYICLADAQAETVLLADQVQNPVPEPADRQNGDPMCVHGHCHHWVGIARMGERYSYTVAMSSLAHARDPDNAPPSAPADELLRPPQA